MIKNFRDGGGQFVLPDRYAVTMTAPFMRAYTELLVAPATSAEPSRSAGWRRSSRAAGTPEVNERALAKVREDKSARPPTGSTARGSPTPTSCRCARRCSTGVLGDQPNQLDRLRDDVQVTPRAARRRATGGVITRRAARQRVGGAAVHRLVAARHRRGRHQQPDGGRRDGGDLALADLAVDRQRRRARRHRRDRHARPGASHPVRGARPAEERPGVRRGAVRSGRATSSNRSRWRPNSSTSSRCPPTTCCATETAVPCLAIRVSWTSSSAPRG